MDTNNKNFECLEDTWKDFCSEVMSNETQEAVESHRLAYYGGAMAVMTLLDLAGASRDPEIVKTRFQEMRAELSEFQQRCREDIQRDGE